MPRKPKSRSDVEVIRELTDALRQTARQPSIFGYHPQEHQIKFHSSDVMGRAFIGGNRSGKTVGGATEAVWWLKGEHPYIDVPRSPIYGRVVAVDLLQGVMKIVLPEVAKWVPPSLLIDGSWEASYSKSERTLTLTNGSKCEFLSYDQDLDKFAGTSRHFCWFDEEPPESIFNECLLRLVDVKGKWWMTMTPLIDMSWTYDRIYEPWKNKTTDDIEVFVVDTSQNKYVDEAYLDLILAGMSTEEKAARKAGQYLMHEGLIYKGSFKPHHVIADIVETESWPTIQSKWGHFMMLDHGFTNPTAVLWGAFDQEGKIIIYDEYYQSKKLVKENAEAILERSRQLQVRPDYIVGDPSIRNTDPISGGSILTEYAEYGVNIALANNDVSAGITRVQNRFAQNLLFISSRCKNTLWEINRYRWDKYTSVKIAERKNLKETPIKKNDHAMDALRYGVVSRPALSNEIDLPVGNVLNSPWTAINMDRDLMLVGNNTESKVWDEYLGSEW